MNSTQKYHIIAKLSDIAQRINDLHPDRSKWTFDRYISGRDFDPGEIRLKKSHPIKGNENIIGPQYKWAFQPGDVLYVVKNSRLRKAAMVNFEGICSISTFVIRTDNSKFLQNLLPFLLQTEDFVSFARKHEHGSTNPFLNWKDIAKYEFYLPTLDDQKKISELLWSVEGHIEKFENLIQKLNAYKTSKSNELLTRGIGHTKFKKVKWMFGKEIEIPEEWKLEKLKDNSIIKGRIGWHGLSTAEYKKDGEFYLVTGTDFKNGQIDWESCVYVDEERYNQDKKIQLKINDILVTKDGTIGKIALVDTPPMPTTLNTGVFVIRPIRDGYLPLFLYYLLNSDYFEKFLMMLKAGSTIRHLFQKDFENFPFVIPPITEQQKIVNIMLNIDKQIKQLENYLSTLKTMRHSILNEKLTQPKMNGKIV